MRGLVPDEEGEGGGVGGGEDGVGEGEGGVDDDVYGRVAGGMAVSLEAQVARADRLIAHVEQQQKKNAEEAKQGGDE